MNFEKLKPYVREAGEKTVNAPNELPVRYLIAYQIILVIAGRATIHAKDTKIDKYNTAKYGVLDTKHYSDELHRSHPRHYVR